MTESHTAAEVLACPHCSRLFRLTPAVLGKTIRCRDCRQTFHVPRDTRNVPLGPAVESVAEEALPPVAIASMRDGRDVRSCPTCGRTFVMRPAFVGTTIRCRGCKDSFRVLATPAAPSPPPAASVETRVARAPAAPPPPPRRRPPLPPPPPAPARRPPPVTIFDDIGDVLEELVPGEPVLPVVRPRNMPRRPTASDRVPVAVIMLSLVGLCVVLAAHLPQPAPPQPDPRKGPGVDDVAAVEPPPGDDDRRPPWPPEPPVKPQRPRVVPPPQPLPPADAAAIDRLLEQAYAALAREHFAVAEDALVTAFTHVGTNREADARVQRWRLFATYVNKYRDYRNQAYEIANQGREYDLDGEVFVVSEIGPDHVVYRMRGTQHRVSRAEFDPRLELAIVGAWFAKGGKPANHIYLGARWLCLEPPDREQARREWQTAGQRGARVDTLLPLLDEPCILAAGGRTQAGR